MTAGRGRERRTFFVFLSLPSPPLRLCCMPAARWHPPVHSPCYCNPPLQSRAALGCQCFALPSPHSPHHQAGKFGHDCRRGLPHCHVLLHSLSLSLVPAAHGRGGRPHPLSPRQGARDGGLELGRGSAKRRTSRLARACAAGCGGRQLHMLHITSLTVAARGVQSSTVRVEPAARSSACSAATNSADVQSKSCG